MSHLLWTWKEWGKDKYGLMARVLGDTGLLMLMVIARDAVMLEALNLPNVSLVVDNPPNDGTMAIENLMLPSYKSILESRRI